MDRGWTGAYVGNFLLRKFDPEKMIILKWLNSFEYLLDYSKTEDDDKGKFLLHMIENSVFLIIKRKVYPSNPYDLSYDQLTSVLVNEFSYFHGKNAANFRYGYRHQLPHESVDHYIIALRKLYSKCSSNIKQIINLKNRFIKGLRDPKTRALLKKKGEISFGMAISIAKQMEHGNYKQSEESSSE